MGQIDGALEVTPSAITFRQFGAVHQIQSKDFAHLSAEKTLVVFRKQPSYDLQNWSNHSLETPNKKKQVPPRHQK